MHPVNISYRAAPGRSWGGIITVFTEDALKTLQPSVSWSPAYSKQRGLHAEMEPSGKAAALFKLEGRAISCKLFHSVD